MKVLGLSIKGDGNIHGVLGNIHGVMGMFMEVLGMFMEG